MTAATEELVDSAVPVSEPIELEDEFEIIPPVESLTMLVHADSKVGKSFLSVSTRPPRLYLDVENASAKISGLKITTWDPRDAPPAASPKWDTCVVHIRTWQDALDAMDWLQSGNHPFVSISLDSVSELQNKVLDKIAGRNQVKIQDWGGVLREMGGWLRDLRDLTVHPTNPITSIVITSMTVLDTENKIQRPYLQGQLKNVIPYLWDVVGYMYIEEDENENEVRWMLTRRVTERGIRIEAGERIGGKIPARFKLPNISAPTSAEVAAKNRIFESIRKRVYKKDAPAVEAPASIKPEHPVQATTTEEQ